MVRLLLRRPEPEVEVEFRGRRLRRLVADVAASAAARAAVLVAQPARHEQLAELAGLGERREVLPAAGCCGSACRAGRCACACGPSRPRCGPRGCCASTASRRTRPCRPRRPRSSSGCASGSASRSRPRSSSLSSSALRMSVRSFGSGRPRAVRLAVLLLSLPASWSSRFLIGPLVRVDEVRDLDVLHAHEGVDVRLAAAVQSGDGDADRVVCTEHFAGRLGSGDGDGRGGRERVLEERCGGSGGAWRASGQRDGRGESHTERYPPIARRGKRVLPTDLANRRRQSPGGNYNQATDVVRFAWNLPLCPLCLCG